MVNDSYSRVINASCTPADAYRALTSEINKWWATTSNEVTMVGDIVTFQFPPTYWTMHATKLVPYECVELECIEAHHIDDRLPSTILQEWKGTKLKWKIESKGNNTELTFVHKGLVPSLDCYEICEAGWDHFFVNSLKSFLETGKGSPGGSGS